MNIGYNLPLYLLPFDHRQSYVKAMFGLSFPLTDEGRERVARSKRIVYEGYRQALADGVPTHHGGILVDEEFGADILRDASAHGYITALPVEKSGSDEFEFEYGYDFPDHIARFNPTFVKVLVRYNPEGDADMNRRQAQRLRQVSDYCRDTRRFFMFELLVPATPRQMEQARDSGDDYDLHIRPGLMARAVQSLQEEGVEPDVWKIEGLDLRQDCERMVEVAQRDGRTNVSCIVLGRGADEKKVADWVGLAATVPGYVGFAVGRTTFWGAVADHESGAISDREASARIAARYRRWVDIFAGREPLRASDIDHHGGARGSE